MKTSLSIATLFFLLSIAGCSDLRQYVLPGKLPDGRVRLPNGWYLSPAGSQVEVGELPLNMVVTPDERFVITTDDGTARQSLSVVDVPSWRVVQSIPVAKSWLGIRLFDNGRKVAVSGGNDNRIDIYAFKDGNLRMIDSLSIPLLPSQARVWVAGLDIDERRGLVYAAGKEDRTLSVISLRNRMMIARLSLPSIPYTCLVSTRHDLLFVSLWGGASIAFIDRNTNTIVRTVPVGDHPCDMIESPDGRRLFVANANTNTVSVVNVGEGRVTETLSSALAPGLPYGSTPNALALSPNGRTLYIANADNNYLAVMDVSRPGMARSLGFIPTGWYPTSVRVLASSGTIVVANGKGGESKANPGGPNPDNPRQSSEYIGSLFLGSLSRIDPPDDRAMAVFTQAVYANSKIHHPPVTPPDRGWLTGGKDARSPIEHVFYIIKENRTYDQVFGDMPEGNGDPSLCLFGEEITPNHHALAGEFVLLDNFYADAEVSADGHNWTMGAYATDYTEKTWPTSYGGRGGEYEFEGGYPIVSPSGGYLWDNCSRQGISYRTYGEFVGNPAREGDSAKALLPVLAGHVAPFCRGWDLRYSDISRYKDWEKEFNRYEREGGLPRFQTIKLPNDHTEGTHRGTLTPRAFVAQNDVALGMIVERISHSPYWTSSAIFVVEDDAQNGADHVDAHRTVALVISPYTRRHFVDSELYSTSSMVRTIEMILGLPPLSQFDAAATPMDASFTSVPDVHPYRHRSARIDLEEKNKPGAFGWKESEEMDFTREDAAPDFQFGEIVWRSVKGDQVPMPPPVRSAFVRVPDETDDDGD
jgi:YVTN family beta-propeller protein